MKRVLVVENDEIESKKLALALEARGFDVLATWSGQEALDLLGAEEFDGLVVDDYLPDMHVDNFLSLIAKLAHRPIIVVMSGDPDLKAVKRFKSLQVAEVIDKRFLATMPQSIALILDRNAPSSGGAEPTIGAPGMRTWNH